MRNSNEFDYDEPSRDTLAGIYVEVTDSIDEDVAGSGTAGQPATPVPAPRPEDLYGFTLSVDDRMAAERSSRGKPKSPTPGRGDMCDS